MISRLMQRSNGFIVFCLIITCVVGVGLFTGQEVATYFGAASIVGFVAAVVSAIVFFLLLKFCLRLNANIVYQNLLTKKWFKICIVAAYIIVAAAMLSALSAVIGTFWVGLVLCLAAAFFASRFSKVFEALNVILCIVMLIVFFVITGSNIKLNSIDITSYVKFPFVRAILFACFNLFITAPFLAKKGEQLSKKSIIIISIASAIVLFMLVIISMLALVGAPPVMPFLYLSGRSAIFIVTLCIVASTTLFGMFSSIKEVAGNSKLSYLFCILAVLAVSLVPFEQIVGVFYVAASVFALYFFVRVAVLSR